MPTVKNRTRKTKAQLKKEFENAKTLLKITILALRDYDAVAKTGIVMYMGDWCRLDEDGKPCSVCFAGAVMANRSYAKQALPLIANRNEIYPEDFNDDLNKKFLALNSIRDGYINNAYHVFYDSYLEDFDYFQVRCHYEDPKGWREDMNKLVKHLRKLKI